MVMLMRTLLFPVDNGLGEGLSGDGYAAEYDLWTGKVTWRRIGDETIEGHRKIASLLTMVSAALSPLLIMSFVLYTNNGKLPDFALQDSVTTDFYKYAPLILGGGWFLSFEVLMLAIRSRYPLATTIPTRERQYNYFKSMYDYSIRKNEGIIETNPPILGLYITLLLVLLAAPLAYYFYLRPNSFTDYLAALLITSMLISLYPNVLWNVLLKQLIYIKLIRKTKGDKDE